MFPIMRRLLSSSRMEVKFRDVSPSDIIDAFDSFPFHCVIDSSVGNSHSFQVKKFMRHILSSFISNSAPLVGLHRSDLVS